MSMMKTVIGLGSGFAAIAATSPAFSQYYPRYNYSRPYAVDASFASQQCSAAVQNRLYDRSTGGIIGAIIGERTNGQVLSVTGVSTRGDGTVRVRGLASSGRYAMDGYGRYGEGAYGALGYNYSRAADLSFHCDVAPNGEVYNVDINRR